jgi:hypothetical protein
MRSAVIQIFFASSCVAFPWTMYINTERAPVGSPLVGLPVAMRDGIHGIMEV